MGVSSPLRARPGRVIPAAVALAAAHAVLFAAASCPGPLWPLTFIAVVPLAILAAGPVPLRIALLAVLVCQVAMWLVLERWVLRVTALGYPMLALCMSMYPLAFVWLVRRWSRDPRLSRVPAAVMVPVLWVGLEFLRGDVLFHGYPWFLAGQPLVEWPILAQSADLLGTYFLSFLVLAVGGVIVDAVRERGLRGRWAAAAAAVAAIGAAHVAYGAWRLGQDGALRPGPTFLAVQTNLPQDNKIGWPPQQQMEDVLAFVRLTTEAHEAAVASGRRPDLVIWPETMVPGFGLEPETIRTLVDGGWFPGDLFSRAVADLSARLATPMLVGSPAYLGLRPQDDRWAWDVHYNSAYLVDGDPPHARYDKVFLTPFGETMPYISGWKWLERKLLALGAAGMTFDLDAAEAPVLLELRWSPPADSPAGAPGLVVLATPICFEDTVARFCRRMIYEGGRKRAEVLVNLSNDGWFGDHDAGRARHGQVARLRCIENRVPLVRCVNTGMSMAADSCGRMLAVAGQGRYGTGRRAGWIIVELPLDSRSTLYGTVGEVWGWACLLAAGGLGTAMAIRRGERDAA